MSNDSSIVVMLVDDDVLAMRAMLRVLASSHYQLVSAHSGQEALALISGLLGASVKLLLLDFSLGDMSGDALEEEVMKLIPDAKILFISGYDLPHLGDRFIEKPFDVYLLRERVLKELGFDPTSE
jgi:two-component system, cell cycle sensor histidine kinase and response regulator CckA